MDLQEFLTRVLPPTGTYFAAEQGQANNKFIQRHTEDLPSLVKEIKASIQRDKAAYFATGAFKPNSTRRTNNNIDKKKSLYLDMDCGTGKVFATKADAATQLFSFCKEVKLPRPNLMVDSGNGIHAYWTFDQPIPYSEWLELADILKDLCVDHEFNADPVVTSDGTRIMRAPTSINKKDPANPKKCRIIGTVRGDYPVTVLKKLLVRHANKPVVPNVPNIDHDDLSANALAEHEWYAKFIFNECPTIKHIKQEGGQGCSEPLWMHTLNLLAFCSDGASYVHPVSNQHPGYNARATEQKFNLRLQAKEEGRSGPTLCKTFAQYPQAKCATCPHNGVIKSPITLGKEPPPPPETLPRGYKQDIRGTYFTVEGERIPVCAYHINKFEIQRSPIDGKSYLYAEFSSPNDVKKRVLPALVDQKAFAEPRTLQGIMMANQIYLADNETRHMKQLMTSWAQQLQNANKINEVSDAFGWCGKNFSAGGKKFTPTETYSAPIADNMLQDYYRPTGSLDKWKETAQYVMETGRPEILPILASSFAAPLMEFSPVRGVTLSLISDSSGTGKSTALRVAQSVWGHPTHGINVLNDTANSVTNRLASLRNLPLYWDELRGSKKITDFLSFVIRATYGRDKSRLTQNSRQMQVGNWKTIIISASNAPLKDYIDAAVDDTDAGLKRIFEIEMEGDPDFDTVDGHTMLVLDQVEKNYGHAGDVYAAYLVKHKEEITKRYTKVYDYVLAQTNASPDERFWIHLITSLLLGASLAKQTGLLDFDIKVLKDVLFAALKDMRGVTTTLTTVGKKVVDSHSLMQQFVHEMNDYVYVTESFADAKGEVGKTLSLPERNPVRVHIAQGDNLVRIDKAALRAWLKQNGHQQATVITNLVKTYGAHDVRTSLTPKLPGGNARTRAYEMPWEITD